MLGRRLCILPPPSASLVGALRCRAAVLSTSMTRRGVRMNALPGRQSTATERFTWPRVGSCGFPTDFYPWMTHFFMTPESFFGLPMMGMFCLVIHFFMKSQVITRVPRCIGICIPHFFMKSQVTTIVTRCTRMFVPHFFMKSQVTTIVSRCIGMFVSSLSVGVRPLISR